MNHWQSHTHLASGLGLPVDPIMGSLNNSNIGDYVSKIYIFIQVKKKTCIKSLCLLNARRGGGQTSLNKNTNTLFFNG